MCVPPQVRTNTSRCYTYVRRLTHSHLLYAVRMTINNRCTTETQEPTRVADHFALRPQKRGGLLGTGQGGKGTTERRLDRGGYRPKKTGETVDRRQNNGSVKAVSPRHCPTTCALRDCCFHCRVWAESQRQCPLHCC